MDKLLRTQVDRFHLSDSLKLSEIEALAKEERILERIVTVEEMFSHLPAYETKPGWINYWKTEIRFQTENSRGFKG